MSAGICGKRLGLEEIFGSPSAAPAKKLRCCSSPIRSDFGFGSDDKLSILIRMFPSMDPEVQTPSLSQFRCFLLISMCFFLCKKAFFTVKFSSLSLNWIIGIN